ncbi:MAG: ribonuclease P protein component [bacterium]|nr:ribonuclease P protein component [bacterium]
MLPRANRLSAKRDVERVSRMGRPVFAPDLTVRCVPNRVGHIRMTVVAGLKVSKRSNERNRAKRLVREAIHRNLAVIHPNADIVVYAKSSIVGKDYRTVSGALGRAFTKAGLLRGRWVDNQASGGRDQESGSRG